MKVLIGCEESQTICKEFRALGHEAFSCDLDPCSGGHPEWHLQCNVLDVLDQGWDLAIFHPECTYLTSSGLHWNGKVEGRAEKTEEALDFVRKLMAAPIEHIAIENPVGKIGTAIRKANQYIQPYNFGHSASKTTGLWLKNLPLLQSTKYVSPEYFACCGDRYSSQVSCEKCSKKTKPRWSNQTPRGQDKLGPSEDRAKIRSKTYEGIAKAIAEQWSKYILESETNGL